MGVYPYIDDREAAEIEEAQTRILGDVAQLEQVEALIKQAHEVLRTVQPCLQTSVAQRWVQDLETNLDAAEDTIQSLRDYPTGMDLATARGAA